MHEPALTVCCLCAAWCRNCDSYRPVFAAVARRHPDARFVWVDIETHSDRLGDELDVDNFPTVAVLRAQQLRFFGALTPHPATLERLLTAADGLAPAAAAPPGLAQALAALGRELPAE